MRKGFTLIELLIVIGILAILATTVVLVLNPAQILAESRDTQRISDLGSVNSAIGLYLATAGSPTLANGATTCVLPTSAWRSDTAAVLANQPFTNPTTLAASIGNNRATDGTGWASINFQSISGGSPLAALPTDPSPVAGPLDTTGRFYAYQCSGTTYEINASMESTKFSSPSATSVESTDGGTLACSASPAVCNITKANNVYEIGTAPGLAL